MKKLSDNNVRERLSALFGLAATKNDCIKPCPSPQQLALFIDRQLKKKVHSQMLTHLNHCEDCRNIWLETTRYLESKPGLEETSFAQKIIQGIGHFLTPTPLLIGSVTVALLFLFVAMPSFQLDQQIESEYESIISQNDLEATSIAKVFIMPWDNSVMAFGKTDGDHEQKAFGSGLWQGKNQLSSSYQPLPARLAPLENRHWQDTNWNSYYQFGRLVILLWVETQLTSNNSDWNKYELLFMQLHESLTEHENNTEITLAIEQIVTKIKVLKVNDQQNIIEKKPLQRLLEIIMQKYSPD